MGQRAWTDHKDDIYPYLDSWLICVPYGTKVTHKDLALVPQTAKISVDVYQTGKSAVENNVHQTGAGVNGGFKIGLFFNAFNIAKSLKRIHHNIVTFLHKNLLHYLAFGFDSKLPPNKYVKSERKTHDGKKG